METISKAALEARLLECLRKVEETGEELVVTDHGNPVIRIVPVRKRRSAEVAFSDVRGGLVYHEDILAPTTEAWPDA